MIFINRLLLSDLEPLGLLRKEILVLARGCHRCGFLFLFDAAEEGLPTVLGINLWESELWNGMKLNSKCWR
jgi:hypothetical protein